MAAKHRNDSRKVFAQGYNFYKVFWIFLLGSLIGDGVETLWGWGTTGQLMSRSSLLYGPFSVVWGIGAVVLTITLHGLAKKRDLYIFVVGTLLGGAYEYVCSLVTEYFFGVVFWDYSDRMFNIDGRVNLLFCIFWGLLSLIWVKDIYPRLSNLIEKIPIRLGQTGTILLVIFMVANMALTSAALYRADQRASGNKADTAIERFLDRQYPDTYLAKRYQNMKKND
ncbi:MAG: putative ABC transporter permease [Lachnospiraceae bacterium]